MKALAIAGSNLRRTVRDRSNLFFVLIFPIALVLLIGSVFGGDFVPSIGVATLDPGPLAGSLVEALEGGERLAVVSFASEHDLLRGVERGRVEAGVVIPAGYGAALQRGQPVEVGFIARPGGVGPQLQATVEAIIAEETAPLEAARFASSQGAGSLTATLPIAEQISEVLPAIEIAARTSGEALFPATLGRFDLGASSQLLLFMFVNGLAGSAALIQTRQLGISTRMLSTPTPVRTIVAGEGLGRFGMVLVQGLYIVAATLLLFGVNWGDPLGAAAVVVLFAAVGAGAAMLMGALFRNDQQASGFGVMFGLGLAALGGCMLPIELFSPTLRTVAHLTPHAWANDAFAELVRRDGTIVTILPELGVLAGFALVLLGLATWRLRRVITKR